MPSFRAAKTWQRSVPAPGLEDLGLPLPQGLAGVCWSTERSSCPDTAATESRLLKTRLLNPKELWASPSKHQKAANRRGCRLTRCPSSSLLAPCSSCYGEGGNMAWWPRDSCACCVFVFRKKPVVSPTCSIPQHSDGEAQLGTLCQAATLYRQPKSQNTLTDLH